MDLRLFVLLIFQNNSFSHLNSVLHSVHFQFFGLMNPILYLPSYLITQSPTLELL